MLKIKDKEKKTLKRPEKLHMMCMGNSNSNDCWFLITNHGSQQTVEHIFLSAGSKQQFWKLNKNSVSSKHTEEWW